ncbi:hypothetical protein [Pontiella agarivorans]|uniref:Uncharacterized protein n=1 Tax=Pontiella agarivorans TaxID=3038953 RepID=A0ABU5MVP9_9BACT|nr:hypothetical protein [Pontiella agarivorans]MDZ8118263.1 hypothetical protein [Pontiella agarivorans]
MKVVLKSARVLSWKVILPEGGFVQRKGAQLSMRDGTCPYHWWSVSRQRRSGKIYVSQNVDLQVDYFEEELGRFVVAQADFDQHSSVVMRPEVRVSMAGLPAGTQQATVAFRGRTCSAIEHRIPMEQGNELYATAGYYDIALAYDVEGVGRYHFYPEPMPAGEALAIEATAALRPEVYQRADQKKRPYNKYFFTAQAFLRNRNGFLLQDLVNGRRKQALISSMTILDGKQPFAAATALKAGKYRQEAKVDSAMAERLRYRLESPVPLVDCGLIKPYGDVLYQSGLFDLWAPDRFPKRAAALLNYANYTQPFYEPFRLTGDEISKKNRGKLRIHPSFEVLAYGSYHGGTAYWMSSFLKVVNEHNVAEALAVVHEILHTYGYGHNYMSLGQNEQRRRYFEAADHGAYYTVVKKASETASIYEFMTGNLSAKGGGLRVFLHHMFGAETFLKHSHWTKRYGKTLAEAGIEGELARCVIYSALTDIDLTPWYKAAGFEIDSDRFLAGVKLLE